MSSASFLLAVVDVTILSMTCSLDVVDLIFSLNFLTVDGEALTKVGFVAAEYANAFGIGIGDVVAVVVVVDALSMGRMLAKQSNNKTSNRCNLVA